MTTRRKDARLPGNGGQFAPEIAPESSELDLLEPWGSQEQVEYLVSEAHDGAVYGFGRMRSSSAAVDVDDIAQEAILAVLERQSKGAPIDDVGRYARRAAASISTRSGPVRVRSEDLAATKILNARVRALGREISNAEFTQMAEEIRENWPDAKHRPSQDFFHNAAQKKEQSLDAMLDTEPGIFSEPSRVATDTYVQPGSSLDQALMMVEGHVDKVDVRHTKRLVWNALAERCGAPVVRPVVGHRAIKAAYSRIDDAAAFQRALAHVRDEAAEVPGYKEDLEAFFTPWSKDELDARDERAVIEMLDSQPAYAYDLWQMAVRACSARQA